MVFITCPIAFGFDDDFDKLNFALFSGVGMKFEQAFEVWTDQGLFKVECPKVALSCRGRGFKPARITHNGHTIIHPFYRSSGTATPDLSPEGTWWPCQGIFAAEVSPLGHDWIGKRFFDPKAGRWISHDKETRMLPDSLRLICEKLKELDT